MRNIPILSTKRGDRYEKGSKTLRIFAVIEFVLAAVAAFGALKGAGGMNGGSAAFFLYPHA